jgi:hypothetical protein
MKSEVMVNANHHSLVSFLYKHFDEPQSISNLAIHDAWVEDQLIKSNKGYVKGKEFLHPILKLGLSGDIERVPKTELKPETKVPQIREKKVVEKHKTFEGIKMGTKKEMTFSLTEKKIAIADIIKQVKEKFPEAQEKSLKIWHKRALKALKEKKK